MAQVLLLLLIALLTPGQLLTDTPVQVRITDSCAQLRPRETLLDLEPDSPLVLTHRIRLLPGPGAACAQCGGELTGLQERMEQLERQVSELRERCGGAEGCCGSQQSRGSVCSTVRPSTDACPDGCSEQGRCVEGRCVCDSGFTGPDCSESSCPGDCSNRGRCVEGRCVCESGFTGPDCSVKACPDDCNDRGRCVDGLCVCDSGFSGPDCSSKSCPNSCSNRGRCVRGRCVCRRGFTGPDCSQCQPGFSGENCDTPLMGVSRLSTRDISESSVTVFWTPPPLLYDTYHISFSSSKETEQKISSRISGRLSSYTQTGLAAGQEYTVTVTGEKDGVMGAESAAQFTTLISGPRNLRVVKTSTTSVIVQWEKAQGEIDRYVLSVAPNQTDGSSGPREMSLPPERDSAQIEGLHAGRLYEVSVMAEQGSTRSLPARAQATPGRAPVSGNSRERTPPFTNSTFLQHRGLMANTRVQHSGNFSRLKPGMFRPGLKRPLHTGTHGMMRRPFNPEIKHFTSLQTGVKRQITAPSTNTSTVGDLTNVDSNAEYPDPKPLALTVKETPSQQENNDISLTRESVDTRDPSNIAQTHTRDPSANAQTHTRDPSISVPTHTQNPSATSLPVTHTSAPREEPTVTTERNLTALINGTRCVRKVLVGYKRITGNTTDGSLLSKNMTVVVGHVNGNDLLHTLNQEQNKVVDSEARGRVNDGQNEQIMKKTLFSTGPESADQQPDTSASPVPQGIRQVGDQPTGSRPTWRNTVWSSLPASRTQARPKPAGSSFPASTDVSRLRTPSSSSSSSSSASSSTEMNTTAQSKDSPTSAARFQMRNRSELMPHQNTPYRRLRRPHISALQNHTRPALDPNQTRRPALGPAKARTLTPDPAQIHRVALDPVQDNRLALGPDQTRRLALDSAQTRRPAPPSRPMIRLRHRVPPLAGHTGSRLRNTLQLHNGPNRDSGASADTDQRMVNHNNTQKYELSSSKQHVEVSNQTSARSEREWTAPKQQFRPFTITQPELETRDDDEDDEDEDGLETAAGRGSGTSAVFGSAGPHTQMAAEPPSSGHSHSLSTSGKDPAFHSTTHNLILHAGPEPPSALLFSDVTDSSFTVTWKKPKSKVSGFKITHTHVQEGEPISVSVDSETLRLDVSSRAPGSTYEVRVVSVLGQDESDPITDTVTTLPDAPTHLQAINVTDSEALLIWRPALATVDHYRILYSPEAAPDSAVSISVSGNAAQHHLQSLHSSTRYTVSISSRRGEQSSSSSSTAFSTTSGAGRAEDGPRDLKATQVTPRSAVLSWRPPESPISGYRLSYYTDQQDRKELVLDAGVSELHLRHLVPSSVYTAQLQAERAGLHTHTVHTHFTTGSLRFPFPTDCSQERLNGALESGPVEVFPQGRSGRPLRVYCDMETDGGGWTVFQRRKDGKTNFFRRWREYSSGFGTLDGEFWMGNELLHNFTQSVPMELRVDLRAGSESAFARYSSFTIDTAKKHYTLRVAGYSGSAGDSLSYHSGRPFSARDRDPRPFITRCAMSYRGGWWYKNCHEANLNGLYNTSSNHQGVIWTAWKGQDFSIPFTEMKFRPASFKL